MIAGTLCAGTASYAQLDTFGQNDKIADLPEQFHCKNAAVFKLVKTGLFYEGRDLDAKALTYFNEALRVDPKCADALFYRGNVYSGADQYKKAIEDYTAAITIAPAAAMYMKRALAYTAIFDLHKAITDMDQVLKLNPHNIGALQFRAKCFGKLKMNADALKDQSECIALQPRAPFFYYTRATTYKAMHQYQKAADDYSTIIKSMADDDEAYARRAECQVLLGKYDAAISDLTKVIKIDPKGARPYLLERASVYEKINKHSLALQDRVSAGQVHGHEGYLP